MHKISCMLFIVLPLTGAFGQEPAHSPAAALRVLEETASNSPGSLFGVEIAAGVLQQAYGSLSEIELDEFALELESFILAGVEQLATDAALALIFSTIGGEGVTPYANAANVLVRVYERYRDTPSDAERARDILNMVYLAKGQEYVLDLFRASEQPNEPCFDGGTLVPDTGLPPPEKMCSSVKYESEWCRAAYVLLFDPKGPICGSPDFSQFVRYCGQLHARPYVNSDFVPRCEAR